MANNIEKNIDISGWTWAKEVKEYKDRLEWKEIGKQETGEDREQAAELLKEIESTEWTTEGNNKKLETDATLIDENQRAIDQLNRPEEAKKWIAKSILDIEKTIQESKHEKWIPGFFGKVINKILG